MVDGSSDRTDAEAPDPGSRIAIERGALTFFRSAHRPRLVCAVAQGRPPPGFVDAGGWILMGTFGPHDPRPFGYHARAAADSVRMVGFYLFDLEG